MDTTNHLLKPLEMLNQNSVMHTAKEIERQPGLWLSVFDSIINQKEIILNALQPFYENKHANIILTGAGSSDFIGKTIQHIYKKNINQRTSAVSSTSLVTHFKNYVRPEDHLLIISFARSGNSPESNAVINLAEKYCTDVHHIAITCNKSGELAKKVASLQNGLTLVLPPESEDLGLAMTGSFTGMMLAGILISNINNTEFLQNLTVEISAVAKGLIEAYSKKLSQVAALDFDRIVFLGSGPLLSIARESQLKVQELTNGLVIGKHDSFLGFRHGPKVIINRKTLIVYLFSQNSHVFKYETDLANEISNDNMHMNTIGLFGNSEQAKKVQCDLNIVMDSSQTSSNQNFSLLPYVLPAQILGFYKSLYLGINPDTPSDNGSISRVVKGVTIYPAN